MTTSCTGTEVSSRPCIEPKRCPGFGERARKISGQSAATFSIGMEPVGRSRFTSTEACWAGFGAAQLPTLGRSVQKAESCAQTDACGMIFPAPRRNIWSPSLAPDRRTFGLQDRWEPSSIGTWGSGSDNVWVGGNRDVLHWDGASWSSLWNADEYPSGIFGIWGAKNDVWFVGGRGGVSPRRLNETVRLSPFDDVGPISSVWESSPDDVWFSGDRGLFHWDGVRVALFDERQHFFTFWGARPDDVWAAGQCGHLAHWNGSTWEDTEVSQSVVGLAGTSSMDVWSVGCQEPGPERFEADVLHWDGTHWERVPLSEDLFRTCPRRIWGSAPDDYWMAGWLVLAHWDGNSWSRYRVRGSDVVDVWGSARDDVWTGTIEYTRYDQIAHLWHWDGLYRWNGSQLKPVGRAIFRQIRGAQNEVWGVGYKGVQKWTPSALITQVSFRDRH